MKLRLTARINKTATDPKHWRDKYDKLGFLQEGLAKVELNGKWGFVDEMGKEVIPLNYDEVGSFSPEGFAEVKIKHKRGYIDKKGRDIPKEYITAIKLGGSLDRILEIAESEIDEDDDPPEPW